MGTSKNKTKNKSTDGRVVQGEGFKTLYRKDARVRTTLRALFIKLIIQLLILYFIKNYKFLSLPYHHKDILECGFYCDIQFLA